MAKAQTLTRLNNFTPIKLKLFSSTVGLNIKLLETLEAEH
jgi:hypothetical protein